MQIIDRRRNKNKSTVNRQRFIRRQREQIKEAIARQIGERKITELKKGENISIPSKGISEPVFHQGKGGRRERVYPGNKEFGAGDHITRPPAGGPGSSDGSASNSGEGDDEFAFQLTREEYIDLLFDGLELPRLQKTQLSKLINFKTSRAGFTSTGNPSNINIIRSLKGALARRNVMAAPKKKEIEQQEQQLKTLLELNADKEDEEIVRIETRLRELKEQIKHIPFIDTFDLRFNNFTKVAVPTSQAVMFCLMDVSGSMDQATKEMAKRFFLLLYLFLVRSYENVEIVFIRHHTQAKEVDEEEFFYSRETGGTIVSSALELMHETIAARYNPSEWNIYAAQASDGDNWQDDSPKCHEILTQSLLPIVRYFAYIEITQRDHQSLWDHYDTLLESFPNFAMQHIRSQEDIYPVFRDLFRKQSEKGVAA